MKIEHLLNETTTAGAVSSVAMPLGQTQKRTTENVKGLIPAEKVLKAKKKGPYANSLSEGKEKKPVVEADLQEDDLIIIPGQSKRLKAGFIPKAQDRTDHEVEMAKADLLALYKNTKSVLMCIKDISEDEGLEGWVQEKIIKASDYMNTLAEYFEGKKIQEMSGGVIAAGGVGEGLEDDFAKLTDTFAKSRGIKFKSRELGPKQPTTINEPTKVSVDNATLTSRIKELEAEFDPQFQYSDDYGFWLQQKRIQDEIRDIKKQLAQQDIAESQLNEKAKSTAQQKFFGMAHAMQKGKKIAGASKDLKDVAKSMSKSDVKDFAKTKHKDLPTHVKKEK